MSNPAAKDQLQDMVILGAGQMGQAALGLLNETHWRCLCFGDNQGPWPREMLGLPVLPVAEALTKAEAALVAVAAPSRGQALAEQARSLGYQGRLVQLSDLAACLDIRKASLLRLASRLQALGVAGDLAELGVYQGETAALLNRLFPERRLYLFDTFQGFDQRDVERESPTARFGAEEFMDTSAAAVLARLPEPKRAVIRQGWFPETAQGLEQAEFCLVSLDADLYAPTLAGLEFFWPRLQPGGGILLHDYENPRFPGVKQALAEFEARTGPLPLAPLADLHGTALLLKA